MNKLPLLISTCLLWAGALTPAYSDVAYNEDVAIIIGNKNYEDSDVPAVRFAHNDARAMKAFAKDVLHIREENIIYMEDATQARMQTAFGRRGNHRGKAFQYVKPDVSNLYVFYSGHGLPGQHDQKSYLLPVDSEIETAEINGYPTDLLYENLKQTEAKSVTVFLDACFSGSSNDGMLIKNASGAQIIAQTPKVTDADNLTVITAASKDQLASWDEENKHGLFTEYLLRALYGEADKDHDGQVKLAEVSDYLKQDMRYRARREYNRDQYPTIIGNEDRVLVAALEGIYPTRPSDLGSDEPEIAAPDIDTDDYDLTPVEENMFAVKNANVRRLPSVRSSKVDMIPKGEPIHVAAKVTNLPWYAVEKGDTIIGYVFADLLGEEKEVATEEENRFIRELKARLEKLEQQTQISSKSELPPPPTSDQNANLDVVEDEDDLNEDYVPFISIEKSLKSMGAILARQSFIRPIAEIDGKTSLKYNWIRVEADRCSISASLSLYHDRNASAALNIYDREITGRFWDDFDQKKRKLRTRGEDGKIISQTDLYGFGPFLFENVADRKQFKAHAAELKKYCPTPRQMQSQRYPAPAQPVLRAQPDRRPLPPPPHPQGKRPPPPFR